MKYKLDGGWNIDAVVDSDWHLTIYVWNDDGTPVVQIDEDLGNTPNEIGVRFTTHDIENSYSEDIDEVDAIYCYLCGDRFFKGDTYYIYKHKKYCPYCAGSNDYIEYAIKEIYQP